MPLFSADQLRRVREIIRRHVTSVGISHLGALYDKRTIRELKQAGLLEADETIDNIGDAFAYGQLLARSGDLELMTAKPEEVLRRLEQNPAPALDETEQTIVDTARRHAGQYVTGLADRMTSDVMGKLTGLEGSLPPDRIRETIRDETAANRERRGTAQQLKKALGDNVGNWTRDWQRIATSENNDMIQEGGALSLERDHGDPNVSKLTRPDACPDCVRLYLTAGQGSKPRVFKLSELQANGTNVGRKRGSWLATVGNVHPWCGCQIVRVPDGMEWGDDDPTELVPKSMNKSLRILEPLIKAEPGLPTTWGVVYAHPNPDNSRKRCNNCVMWVDNGKKNGNQCAIHPKKLNISGQHICGYHVFGEPMSKWMPHPGIDPVDPKHSGLELVPSGTSCDNCAHYRGKAGAGNKGKCVAVKGTPTVEARGCCARWEGKLGKSLLVKSDNSDEKPLTGSPFKLHYKTEKHGLPISVENRKGSRRYWQDADGNEGSTKMKNAYGYIRGTRGNDDDEIDVFIGPDDNASKVYVVHQRIRKDDGSFHGHDEDKVMIGFSSPREAKAAYLSNYDDAGFFGSMTTMTVLRFKAVLEKNSGKRLRMVKSFVAGEVTTLGKSINDALEFGTVAVPKPPNLVQGADNVPRKPRAAHLTGIAETAGYTREGRLEVKKKDRRKSHDARRAEQPMPDWDWMLSGLSPHMIGSHVENVDEWFPPEVLSQLTAAKEGHEVRKERARKNLTVEEEHRRRLGTRVSDLTRQQRHSTETERRHLDGQHHYKSTRPLFLSRDLVDPSRLEKSERRYRKSKRKPGRKPWLHVEES